MGGQIVVVMALCSGLSGCGNGDSAPAAEAPVAAPAVPVITDPLHDITVKEGQSALFFLFATGATEFKWRLGGNGLGVGGAGQIVTGARTLDGVTMSVVASNAAGSVESSARLMVLPDAPPIAAAQVVAGTSHALALTRGGQVLAWGTNEAGQLGDGSTLARLAPIPVRDADGAVLNDIVAVGAGSQNSVALRSDGSVFAWGEGQTVPKPLSAAGTPLTGIAALSAGPSHLVMLKLDGTVLTLGTASLRGNPQSSPDEPSLVVDASGTPLSRITAISAGLGHSLALTLDGTVFAWGSNLQGEVGTAATGNVALAAVPVRAGDGSVLSGIRAVSAGARTSYALRTDGTAVAWGSQSAGALGNRQAQGSSAAPTSVVDGNGRAVAGLRALAANGTAAMALDGNGCVLSWGNNNTFQLGQESFTAQFRANAAQVDANAEGAPLCGVESLSSGTQQNAYVITAAGELRGWGINNGHLGDGGKLPRRVPLLINSAL